jgi:hypothetical protein
MAMSVGEFAKQVRHDTLIADMTCMSRPVHGDVGRRIEENDRPLKRIQNQRNCDREHTKA